VYKSIIGHPEAPRASPVPVLQVSSIIVEATIIISLIIDFLGKLHKGIRVSIILNIYTTTYAVNASPEQRSIITLHTGELIS